MNKLRICFISDTHTFLDKVEIPDCDLLIHLGDSCMNGTVEEWSKFTHEFNGLCEAITHGGIIVYGNHDRFPEGAPSLAKSFLSDRVKVLWNDQIEIEGLKFYGSPYTHWCGWAFSIYNDDQAEKLWAQIPDDTDILLTHSPPYDILDGSSFHIGCKKLRERIAQLKPLIAAWGHHHRGYGVCDWDGITCINAAICDEEYQTTNKPILVELEPKTKWISKIIEGDKVTLSKEITVPFLI